MKNIQEALKLHLTFSIPCVSLSFSIQEKPITHTAPVINMKDSEA